MKSITIHDMDSVLAARLQRQARESGLSLNKAIKKLLAAALGVAPAGAIDRRRDFEGLCGVWSKQEAKAFQKAVREFERVDSEDWA
ncbi:MAG: hypothetical protein A2V88_15535 [Elusimicrobia bacterium RBG_16_66_12]|nr:MAG: hypothetical protein A2V88_15535 [Elusimicrobia bacterium RBG_16_66_12]